MEPPRLAVVVEDDPDVRNLLRTILTQSGFEAILTSNGEDGVEAVRRYQPVLTTLDVSMAGMDGVAAAARIREFSTTYIMMITAQSEEIDVIQGLDAGADEYLLKPFRPRELRARIESLLRRPRAIGSGAFTPPSGEPAPGTVWRRSDHAESGPVQLPQQAPGYSAIARPGPQPGYPTPAYPQPIYSQPGPTQHPVPAQEEDRPALGSQAPIASGYATYAPGSGNPTSGPAQIAPTPAPEIAPSVPTQAQAPDQTPVASMGAHADPNAPLSHHGLVLDPVARVVSVDGNPVSLQPDEFDLLQTVMRSERRVRSKADLVLAARGESYVTTYYVREGDKRDLDVKIAQIRRKLGDTEPSRWLETVRGVGYRMTL